MSRTICATFPAPARRRAAREAAQKTLKKGRKLKGMLTVTVKRPGTTDAKLSHAYTVKLVRKH